MKEELDALKTSVARLRDIVEPLNGDRLRMQAYPTEWCVADVLSHIGSSAVIGTRRVEDAVAGRATPDAFQEGVWDEWNAKSPEAKAADALAADARYLDVLTSIPPGEAEGVVVDLGPVQFDLETFVGLRLNEHVNHTWDIEVTFDPTATLPTSAADLVVDNLAMVAGFSGKPTGEAESVRVHTTDPTRDFLLQLGPDAVSLDATDDATTSRATRGDAAELELPAEALVRLVYGRLDPAHTPSVSGSADLAELRRVFQGV